MAGEVRQSQSCLRCAHVPSTHLCRCSRTQTAFRLARGIRPAGQWQNTLPVVLSDTLRRQFCGHVGQKKAVLELWCRLGGGVDGSSGWPLDRRKEWQTPSSGPRQVPKSGPGLVDVMLPTSSSSFVLLDTLHGHRHLSLSAQRSASMASP